MDTDALAATYDDLSRTYTEGRHLFDTSPMLRALAARLPAGGAILDAGCGAGEPVSRFFVDRGYEVTGVDISHRMLELARARVPEARFLLADMTSLDLPDAGYVGIAAVYSVFHVDRRLHAGLFRAFSRLLVPGGALLMTLATRAYTGRNEFDGEIEFLGHRLPYSHDRPEVALAKLEEARLEILSAEDITTGGETFLWVIARRP